MDIVIKTVYSISMKSIFARAVIGSPGVVTLGITSQLCVPLVHSSSRKKTVHSPLFFRDIVDVDRSVRPDRHLGLLMRAKLGREQNALG